MRENGGQYTHAAIWVVMALARLGMGDEAMEMFHLINPINHLRSPEGVERYRAEPYAVAADVYAHPLHVGRGGWTWYTGSAGWMHQAAVQALLGLQRRGDTISIDPCIPTVWPEYVDRVDDRRDEVSRCRREPRALLAGVVSATHNGVPVDPSAIPVVNDGGEHEVRVVLGARVPDAGTTTPEVASGSGLVTGRS